MRTRAIPERLNYVRTLPQYTFMAFMTNNIMLWRVINRNYRLLYTTKLAFEFSPIIILHLYA